MHKGQLEERLTAWQRAVILAAPVVCAMVLLAFVAEGFIRVRQSIRQGVPWGKSLWGTDQTYVTDPESGLRMPIPNGHFGPVHINSFGFRSPEIPVEKPAGRLRIAFLGGSTTYCAEVSSNQMTWPYLVVAAIQQHFPDLDIDFINGGVPGYTTATLKMYLEKRIARFRPDVIVIYEATNDLSSNSFVLAREQGVRTHTMDQSMGWLAHHSLLAYLVEKNVSILEQQHPFGGQEGRRNVVMNQARLAAMYRSDLTALVEASKKVAGLVVTVTFAPRLRANQSTTNLRRAAITSLYYMPYMTPEAILEGFRHYNDVMRSVAAEEDTLLVGGEDSIPADAQHYKDSVHFSDAGSVLMAKRVTDALLGSDRFLQLAEHTHLAAATDGARRH
jgi:lysophospholipase L1-like esterase